MAPEPNGKQRRNISISDALDKRMAAHPEVNWSAVATAAFTAKLWDLKVLARVPAEDLPIIERLAAERIDAETRAREGGLTAAMEFITQHASYTEMSRLTSAWVDEDGYEHEMNPEEAFLPQLCNALSPTHNVAWFVEQWGTEVHNQHWVTAFLHGLWTRGHTIMLSVDKLASK